MLASVFHSPLQHKPRHSATSLATQVQLLKYVKNVLHKGNGSNATSAMVSHTVVS